MKRLALALVVPALVAVLAPPIAPPAAAQDQAPVSLTLEEQSVVVTPRRAVRIGVLASNHTDADFENLEVKLWIYNPARSRTAYDAGLEAEPPTEALLVAPFVLDGPLGAGETRPIALERRLPELDARGENALYPVKVQLESNGVAIGLLRSVLVFILEKPLVPLNVSVTLVLDEGLHQGPDGVFADDGLERAMAPGGRLVAIVNALEAVPVPVTLAVSPVLLLQLEDMADGYRRTGPAGPLDFGPKSPESAGARQILERIRAIAARPATEVLALPFSAPSIPSLLAAGLRGDLAPQVRAGRTVVEDALGVRPAGLFRPPAGLLSRGAVRALADIGVESLLVDPRSLPPPPGLVLSPPATARTPAGVERTVDAVVPDGLVAARFGSLPADPRLRARWVLGEISAMYFEQPSVDRGVAVVIDERTRAEPEMLEALLRALDSRSLPRRAAWLRPVTASRLLAGSPAETRRLLVPSRYPTYPPSFTGAMVEAQRAIARLDATAQERPPLLDRLRILVLMAEARDFVDDPLPALRFLGHVRARVAEELAKVEPPQPSSVTLTSRGGVIPVTIRNHTGYPVRVRVLLRSPRLEFLEGASREVLLERPVQAFTFPVRAQTTGRFPVTVLLQTPDGAPIAESRRVVRSTAYNRAALFITAGAALFLALWWGRRFLPRTSG